MTYIEKLEYINENIKNLQNNMVIEYTIEDKVLRGIDRHNRIIYIRQFLNERELFQFLCGMIHILEVM